MEIYQDGKAVAKVPIATILSHWDAADIHKEAFRCAVEDGLVNREDFDKCEFGIMPSVP